MDPTRIGTNRTGVQMSPLDAANLVRATQDTDPTSSGGAQMLAALREPYLADAEPVGSVPPPGTLAGAARSGIKMLQGERMQALIDKLGERAAFERGGTRLYDALLGKCAVRDDEAAGIDLDLLQRFRDEEAAHFRLVAEALDELGADPTAQTPCADVTGVATMGLMQVALDPRTSVGQTLQAVLTAELVDNAAWELLITLVREFGYDGIAQRFEAAAQQEAVHLRHIRSWHETAVRRTASTTRH